MTDPTPEARAALVLVSGERARAGKSTACVGILSWLLAEGYAPAELAYIKPSTQCTKSHLVARFCEAAGIESVPIGPIVFRSGFTRECLRGEGPAPETMLAQVRAEVERLRRGRRVVLVDGVGYPAVGNVCGVSNAHVAAALHAPVLLIGKGGVGDAIDSYTLNATFFEHFGCTVLGGVFNRVDPDGFYSTAVCREYVSRFFAQRLGGQKAYGFVPADERFAEPAVGATAAPEEHGRPTTVVPEPAPPAGSTGALPAAVGTAPATWAAALRSGEAQALQQLGLSAVDSARVAHAFAAYSEHVDVGSIVADVLAFAETQAAEPSGGGAVAVRAAAGELSLLRCPE